MDEIKKKNYLKRNTFMNSVDSNKIWSKSMKVPEIKILLEDLEKELLKHDFDIDKNFIMNPRRTTLKKMIEERLQRNDNNIHELVTDSLFNFWEFIEDEYPGGTSGIINVCKELDISPKEFEIIDKTYRDRGIISAQEKDIIIEMIKEIKEYIRKRDL